MMKRAVLVFFVVVLSLCVCFASAEEWVCPNCGKTNTTNFCTSCGTKNIMWECPNCGTENGDAYCGTCGLKRPTNVGDLIATWFFSSSENQVLLMLNRDKTCVARTGYGCMKGKYEVSDNVLSLKFADRLRNFADYGNLSGAFGFIDGNLFYKPFGIAERNDNMPVIFSMLMDGSSMEDLISNGDRLTIEEVDPTEIKRNDIVAVNYPGRHETVFIKRMVGLPGDTIELQDGYLYVNGEKKNESFINDQYRSGSLNSMAAKELREDQYFVLGDHRNNSNDSRSIGALNSDEIIGVVTEINGLPIDAGGLSGQTDDHMSQESSSDKPVSGHSYDPIKVNMNFSKNELSGPEIITVSITVTNISDVDMSAPVTLYYPDGNRVDEFGSPILSAGASKSWTGDWKITQEQLEAGKIVFKISYSYYEDKNDGGELELINKRKNFAKKIKYTDAN